LAIERQIGDNGSLSIAYAGSKGTHLLMQGFATFSNININQIPDQYLALGVAALQAQVANPFFGYVTNPSSPLSQPTVATGYLLEPFPQYDRVLAVDPNLGFSSYNSLQASFHERLRGAAKYSEAKRVEVRLTRSNGNVCLSVSDDGVGCTPDELRRSGGLGVINMRERVLQLRGTFEFKSEPGRGTTVKAEVPFRPAS